MNIKNQMSENRQGGTENNEAEQAEPAKQDGAHAEPNAPIGSEANASAAERGFENEELDNPEDKDDVKNEHVDETLSDSERVAGNDEGSPPVISKRKTKHRKEAEAPLAEGFDFRYITYLHLAEWTTRESKGVMEVLLDQSDDQAVPVPLMNKGGEKEDTTATDKTLKQDKNIGVLTPSWSRTKALQLMIHSPALIANLTGMDRKLNWRAHITALGNHTGNFERVVFIRPFKFLILREAEIRERFKELAIYRANLPPPPPIPSPIPPPISQKWDPSESDPPLQTVAHAVMDNGDSHFELNKSEIWNEETPDEHSNALSDEGIIVAKTEAPPDELPQVQGNEKLDADMQALVSVDSEDIPKRKDTPGADAGGEVPSLATEDFQNGEQSSTEQVTDITKAPDLGAASPGYGEARQELLKNFSEQKKAMEELELAKKAAEEEAARLRPSDAPKPPIKFKDAVGRKYSFPWHIVKTWKGMEELIKQAFLHVDVIGPHVFDGHYDLVSSFHYKVSW
jgi:hypothetical protein